MRNKILLAASVAAVLAAGAAHAANKSTNFTVSATVASNCLITATNLDFGSFIAAADVDSSSTVTVRCTNGTSYTVDLSSGAGSFAARTMSDGGTGSLAYNLYKDAARLVVWGDGTAGTSTNGGTGSGLSAAGAVDFTVYGRVPNSVANSDAPVGSYSDLITATVTY